MTDITEKIAAKFRSETQFDWAGIFRSEWEELVEHIRALESERDAAQAKIEALYLHWLAVDDCEEGSVEMEAAVGAMYLAFDSAHKGPDGYRSWKDAAVAERAQRVAAQAELARLREQYDFRWSSAVEIRWVAGGKIYGRPTSHDVMEYLTQRGEEAKCNCDKCKAFYAEPRPAKE